MSTDKTSQANPWVTELGPLKEFFADNEVSEIMVNGPGSIFVERGGRIEDTGAKFDTDDELQKVVSSLARLGGHELSRKYPCADVLLPDGSRANIVVAPAAVDGPYLTIRRAQNDVLDLRFLVNAGFVDQKSLYFLNVCIANRLNIVVSGGTSTGKTTLLNALIGMIPKSERLVTIEDTLELNVGHHNLARLEARPGSTYVDGLRAKELVRNALRMRPDRIIVGETRGGEAWDIIQAMNSGHEGSLTAIHANHAHSALAKLEAFVLMEEDGVSVDLVRRHISKIINIVVQVERDSEGHRHISEIIEVTGLENGEVMTQQLFSKNIKGEFLSTGNSPEFLKRKRRKISKGFPDDFFSPAKVITLDGFA
ncbi:CpaF family protein [bacterium]|nr:CpaF family protein [bacterium]